MATPDTKGKESGLSLKHSNYNVYREFDRLFKLYNSDFSDFRKNNQRALEELQRTIVEIESRYKGELSRLKKKYDTEIR